MALVAAVILDWRLALNEMLSLLMNDLMTALTPLRASSTPVGTQYVKTTTRVRAREAHTVSLSVHVHPVTTPAMRGAGGAVPCAVGGVLRGLRVVGNLR